LGINRGRIDWDKKRRCGDSRLGCPAWAKAQPPLLEFVEDRFPTKVSIVSGDGDLLEKKKCGRGWYAAPACLGGRN